MKDSSQSAELLAKALREVRHKLTHLRHWRMVLRVVTGLVFFVGLLALVDAWHGSTRYSMAWLYAVPAWLGIACTALIIFLRTRREMSLMHVARILAKQSHPAASELAPALSLATEPLPNGESAVLRNAQIAHVWSQVQGWPWHEIVDAKPLRRDILHLLAAMASLAAMAASYPEASRLCVARLAAPWSGAVWPCPYSVRVVGHPSVVLQGEAAIVRLESSGNAPECRLHVWTSTKRWTQIIDWRQPNETFEASTGPLLENTWFQVVCGELSTSVEQIQVAPRPRLMQLETWVHAPLCKGLSPYACEGATWRAAVGSSVRLQLKADARLSGVKLVLHNHDAPEAQFALSAKEDGWVLPDATPLLGATRWKLEGEVPVENHPARLCNLAEGTVELRPATPPELALQADWQNVIPPQGTWHGIARLVAGDCPSSVLLHVSREDVDAKAVDAISASVESSGNSPNPSANSSANHALLIHPVEAPHFKHDYSLLLSRPLVELSSPGEKSRRLVSFSTSEVGEHAAGDVLLVWLAAQDGCGLVQESTKHQVHVITRQEFEDRLAAEIGKLDAEIRQLASLQWRVRRLLQPRSIATEERPAGSDARADAERVRTGLEQQQRLMQRIVAPMGLPVRYAAFSRARQNALRAFPNLPVLEQEKLEWLGNGLQEFAQRISAACDEFERTIGDPTDAIEEKDVQPIIVLQHQLEKDLLSAAEAFKNWTRSREAQSAIEGWTSAQKEIWQETRSLSQELLRWSLADREDLQRGGEELARRQAEASQSLAAGIGMLRDYHPGIRESLAMASRIPADLREMRLLQAEAAQKRLLDEIPKLLSQTALGQQFAESEPGAQENPLLQDSLNESGESREPSSMENSDQVAGKEHAKDESNQQGAAQEEARREQSQLDRFLASQLRIRVDYLRWAEKLDTHSVEAIAARQSALHKEYLDWADVTQSEAESSYKEALVARSPSSLGPNLFDPLTGDGFSPAKPDEKSQVPEEDARFLAMAAAVALDNAFQSLNALTQGLRSSPSQSNEQLAASRLNTAVEALERLAQRRDRGQRTSQQAGQGENQPGSREQAKTGDQESSAKPGDLAREGSIGDANPSEAASGTTQSGSALGQRRLPPGAMRLLGDWNSQQIPLENREDVQAYFAWLLEQSNEARSDARP